MSTPDDGNSYEARRVRRPTVEERKRLHEVTASHQKDDGWLSRITGRLSVDAPADAPVSPK